jgi:hypothetical protein
MHESVFTLVPCGNNPETFRLYEALQTDSIPLIERCPHKASNPGRHYLNALLKNDDCPTPSTPFDVLLQEMERNGVDTIATTANDDRDERDSPVIPCPLLVVEDWSRVLEVVAPYLPSLKRKRDGLPSLHASDPYHIDTLQRRTAIWWEQFKRCIRKRVTRTIFKNWINPLSLPVVSALPPPQVPAEASQPIRPPAMPVP